jgi:hypothetical protein
VPNTPFLFVKATGASGGGTAEEIGMFARVQVLLSSAKRNYGSF